MKFLINTMLFGALAGECLAQGKPEATQATADMRQLMRTREACHATNGCAAGPVTARLVAADPTSPITISNGASLGPKLAPGGWIAIRGQDLAGTTRAWEPADFNGDALPTVLSGTSVRIGDQDAAIGYVSPTLIKALIRPDAAGGDVKVTVSSPLAGSLSTTITLDDFAPGLFMFDAENRRYVEAVLPDGTFAGKPGLFADNSTLTRPVKAGQRVSLFATGLGTTNPPIPPGLNFSDPRGMNGDEYFHVTVGSQAVTVEFVGAVAPGRYRIDIIAPLVTSGDYAVLIDYAGFGSQPGAMLTIQGDPALSRLTVTPASVTMQAYTTTSTPTSQVLQLLSTGEDFDFSVQSSAAWLGFDTKSGRTPAAIKILADGRTPGVGMFNERITVLAPGTSSPSTTIPVSVSVSAAPQITVSRSSLSYQLVTGFNSLSSPINVLSEAGQVDLTITKTCDTPCDWLSVPTSQRTPGVISVNFNSSSLSARDLHGTVRITPAGGGTPRDIDVSLTILDKAAAGGAPQIVALEKDDLLWGWNQSFTIQGQNLDGATRVTFSPPQGMSVDTVKGSSGSVSIYLLVDATAPEGDHTVTVTTPRGVSNAIRFTVRRSQPQIRQLQPAVVNPGRFYAARGLTSLFPDVLTFGMPGVDLTGISTFQVDPPDDIAALPAVGQAGSAQGVMAVGPSALPGTRRLSVVTPAGRSNELTFEVRKASPNAPIISNLTLSSTYLSSRPNAVNYSGQLDFTDADGDILRPGAKIIFMVDIGSGSEYVTEVVDDGIYLDQTGKTSGTIKFSFQKQFAFLYVEYSGKLRVLCMIQDAAGNVSNTIVAMVSTWQVAVF